MYQINKVNEIEESRSEVRIHLYIEPDREFLLLQGLEKVINKPDIYEIVVVYSKERQSYGAYYSVDEWPFVTAKMLTSSQSNFVIDYVKNNQLIKKQPLPTPFSFKQEWFEVSIEHVAISKLMVVEEGYTGTVGFLTGINHPIVSSGVVFYNVNEKQLFSTYEEAKDFLDSQVNVDKEELLQEDRWMKELFQLYKESLPGKKKIHTMKEIIEEKLNIKID